MSQFKDVTSSPLHGVKPPMGDSTTHCCGGRFSGSTSPIIHTPSKGISTPKMGSSTLLMLMGSSTSSSESSLGSQTETSCSEYLTPPPDPRLHPLCYSKCRKRLRFEFESPLSPVYTPGGQRKRFRNLKYIDEIEKRYSLKEL